MAGFLSSQDASTRRFGPCRPSLARGPGSFGDDAAGAAGAGLVYDGLELAGLPEGEGGQHKMVRHTFSEQLRNLKMFKDEDRTLFHLLFSLTNVFGFL